LTTIERISPFNDFEEYLDKTPTYHKNRISGYLQEAERIQDQFTFWQLLDLEEKAHQNISHRLDIQNVYLSLINPLFDNPAINDLYGVDCMIEKNKKTDDELFQEAYDSIDAMDISDFDVMGFIGYCESQYNMTTKEFLVWFEAKGNEGNVDMKLWALYARNLGEQK
jgi:hypothetical protein